MSSVRLRATTSVKADQAASKGNPRKKGRGGFAIARRERERETVGVKSCLVKDGQQTLL